MKVQNEDKCPNTLSVKNRFPMSRGSGLEHLKNSLVGSGGIRTHASEETGALNQRLRPLGHATLLVPPVLFPELSSLILHRTSSYMYGGVHIKIQ